MPGIVKLRSETSMDDAVLASALERSERALQRIERALSQRERAPARDEALRAKVRAVVEELDELIRQAAA